MTGRDRAAQGNAPATLDLLGEALGAMLGPLINVLEPFIKRAMAEVLAEYAAAERAQPELVDCATMAQLVDCSQAQIHRLCNDGLPFVRLGEVKRFKPSAVYAFLETRTAQRVHGQIETGARTAAPDGGARTPALRLARRSGR